MTGPFGLPPGADAMRLELNLVHEGRITADDYVAAATRREEDRPPLGQVAIEEGVLSVRRVLEVLQRQYEAPSRRFGELAVELGFLSEADLATLLLHQRERERPLVDYLVELGKLTPADVDAARKAREERSDRVKASDRPQVEVGCALVSAV